MKNKLDGKSVTVRIFLYFIGFSALLLLIIWLLQIFFLNSYYEQMKVNEINKVSAQIERQYYAGDDNLTSHIQDLAITNDIYVVIETSDGTVSFSPNSNERRPIFSFRYQIDVVRHELLNDGSSSISVKLPDRETNTNTLAYAKLLDNTGDDYLILYVFSPLYPVDSTVNILRLQLIYITIIALTLSILLAGYWARRISTPLNKITKSAVELGKGNYNVKFDTGSYTEINELASTLNTLSYELEKTDQYQKDLMANVSHDLKTPLTMIKSYAEMIRDISGNDQEKREGHLQVIIDETDRLNQLVGDMMNISKMQTRSVELEIKEFDFTECLKSVMESYNIICENDGYQIELNATRNFYVNGDEGRVKQVIANLINNAVKYCGEDKKIIVNLKRVNGKAHFEVKDNGVGIAKDELPHVWERYYQASAHHVRTTEGSGLGLSICKEILSLHNFNFGVISKIGKGSTFWFDMDIVKSEAIANNKNKGTK